MGLIACASCGAEARDLELPVPDDRERLDPEVLACIDAALAAGDPQNPESFFALGLIYDANGLFEGARASYRGAIELDPDHGAAWYHLGRMQVELGEPEQALSSFQRAGELEGEHAPLHWRRGLVLLGLDRLDEAEVGFRRAAGIAPEDPSGWVGLARVALQRGRGDDALVPLERAASVSPGDGYVQGLLARAHRELGHAAEAEEFLAGAEQPTRAWRDPWTVSVTEQAVGFGSDMRRAEGLLAARKLPQALEILNRLRAERPGNVTVQAMTASVHLDLGNSSEALHVLEEALSASPDHFQLHMNRGLVYLARRDASQAEEALVRATELNPAFAPAHAVLGELYWTQGRNEDAARELRLAFEHGNRDSSVMVLAAQTLGIVGEFGESRRILEEVLRRSPEDSAAWALMAAAQTELHAFEEATASIAKAKQLGAPPDLVATVEGRLYELRPQ